MEHHNLSEYHCQSFEDAHSDTVRDIIELRDGSLVSCSYDGSIKRWTARGKLLTSFDGHECQVTCLTELDDTSFISGAIDNSLKVWHKTTGQCLHKIQMCDEVWSLLRLKHSDTFLCGIYGGEIEEKSAMGNYETLHTLHNHELHVTCLCELSNGDVVSSSFDHTLKVWNMKSRTVVHNLEGHSDYVHGVIALKDNKTVASASYDMTVRIWDVITGQCLRILKGHEKEVRGLAVLSDGTLLSASEDGTVREWSKTQDECVSITQLQYEITCMKGLRDGSVVIGGDDGQVEVRKTWLSQSPRLLELCCQFIAKHHNKFDMAALEQDLPTELYESIIILF
eukprot:TRINITY_DN3595_c0_g4_i1.p1 TRINITY_DN3595_c0_g4~~TRINITY_DN3595_c0_g4_i1.p1  ORF type:complete len:338 (-),score=55.71 TRINITY_DN3595_c0_g4_i1:92-1105(-)